MVALDRELDVPWRADRDYIIADTNGSAAFPLASLKMRRGAAGWSQRRGGGRRAPACDGLPEDVHEAVLAVRPRRGRRGGLSGGSGC